MALVTRCLGTYSLPIIYADNTIVSGNWCIKKSFLFDKYFKGFEVPLGILDSIVLCSWQTGSEETEVQYVICPNQTGRQ